MFNVIFFIGLWIGVYCGKGGGPNPGKLEAYGKGTGKGICLNPEKILHYCMAGTKIGEKMQVAIEKCSKQCGNNHAKPGKGKGKGKGKGMGKGKGKGKGSKGKGGKGKGEGKNSEGIIFECPKINEIKEKFKEAHSGIQFLSNCNVDLLIPCQNNSVFSVKWDGSGLTVLMETRRSSKPIYLNFPAQCSPASPAPELTSAPRA